MRSALALGLLAVGALSGTASADCASDYLLTAGPPPRYYEISTEPSVAVYPQRVVDNVTSFVVRTRTFVECARSEVVGNAAPRA